MKKFNYLFFIIVTFLTSSAIFAMDPTPPTPKKTKKRSMQQNMERLQKYVLDKVSGKKSTPTSTPSSLVSSNTESSSDIEEHFDYFLELPQDVQTFLFLEANAKTLKDAGYIITQLAQTNKTFNELINDPLFCLRIIDTLSKRFNCSNFKACSALQTKEAKNRLAIQKELYLVCTETSKYNDLGRSMTLLNLIKKGAEFNFTYDHNNTQVTPLILCIQLQLDVIYSLLVAGADPEFRAGGITPLQAAEGNEKFTNILKEAIEKKHAKAQNK